MPFVRVSTYHPHLCSTKSKKSKKSNKCCYTSTSRDRPFATWLARSTAVSESLDKCSHNLLSYLNWPLGITTPL